MMKSRISRSVLIAGFALIGISGWVYWEFFHDIDPKEAIAYYSQIELIPDAENGAYAIAGIAAPHGTQNLHAWGYAQVVKNRDRHQRDIEVINILDDQPAADNRLYLNLGRDDVALGCWLSRGYRERDDIQCMSDDTIRDMIESNRELIERYKTLFRYQHLYYVPWDGIGVGKTFHLSRLMIIDFWLNKDNLSDADLVTVLNFFRFWEKVSRNGQDLVDTAISMVNYSYASYLLARFAEVNPDILIRYHKLYGQFYSDRVSEECFDNWNRVDFKSLNSHFCFFNQHEEFQDQCEPVKKTWSFKPGRTIQLLFENRATYGNCTQPNKEHNGRSGLDMGYWPYVFIRPGNFRGRAMAALLPRGMEKACDIAQNLDVQAEQNGFRNLYLHFKLRHYTPEQVDQAYRDNKKLFKIKGTDRFYFWDNGKHLLVWEQVNPKEKYTIPYF
jgi:hypothetical protein